MTDDIDQTEEPENLPTRTQQEKHQHTKNKLKQKFESKRKTVIYRDNDDEDDEEENNTFNFHKIRFNLQPPPNNCYKLEKNCPFIIIKIKSLNT